jgi:UDP-N-acetylglucosamine 2-epimerase
MGTNRIVGTAKDRIVSEALRTIAAFRSGAARPSGIPAIAMWDGKAGERIVSILARASSKS